MYRLHRDSFETFYPISPDPVADNHFLVIAHNGYDKSGLWSFDAKNKKFSEVLYRRNDVDSGQPSATAITCPTVTISPVYDGVRTNAIASSLTQPKKRFIGN